MPSHRDRSASPSRSKHRSRRDREQDEPRDRHRERGGDRERARDEPRERREDGDYPASLEEVGAKEISEDDYFLKAAEFRLWLREQKGKYIDELSGESSRKYFKKFVKRWNGLDLSRQYYRTVTSTAAPSASQTGYKWGFVTNRSKVDRDQLAKAREDVDRLTHGADNVKRVLGPALPSASGSGSRSIGPSLPPSTMFSANHTDRQLALEEAASVSSAARKADRNKAYERAEELVPRASGREGRFEEKRAKIALSKDTGEAEVPDSVLMGDDGGFKAALARRDAAAAKRGDRKAQATADRRAMASERFTEIKSKDAATMEMFKQMAKSRFG